MKSFLLGGPIAKTLLLIIVMLFLLTAMSVRAGEKPLVLDFIGDKFYITFHCVTKKDGKIACIEKRKQYNNATEFWGKFMKNKL